MTQEEIKKWYQDWCKENKRCGSVLITTSIMELLIAFNQQNTKQ